MTLLMRDQENIDKGREQGLKEGREQGLEEGREQGLKEGREQGLEEGREQGLEEGREKGEGRFAELTQRLLQDKRYIDLEKVRLIQNTVRSCIKNTKSCKGPSIHS